MTTYLLRRILLLIPSLIGITLLIFVLVRFSMGDTAVARNNGGGMGAHPMTAEARQQIVKLYGLDKNPVRAYGDWLWKCLHLDLDESFVDHRPVATLIGERLPLTVTLAGSALALSYLIAIPLGIAAALKRGEFIDRAISILVFILYSIPSFVVALLLIFFVAGGDHLNLLPMYGANSVNASDMNYPAWLWDRTEHMILPVACLTYVSLASISRYARVSMLEAIGQDFVRTARAKGLRERVVIFRHALRNALIPIITVFALELPALVGGAVIIEQIFSLPGIGQLYFSAILNGDIPVLMGTTFITAVVTLFSYLMADILYVVVDPRITYS